MHEAVKSRLTEIVVACRRHGVVRLDVFGSAARSVDFDPERSDADFVADLGEEYGLSEYLGLKDDLELVLGRPVDLVTKRALDCAPAGRLDAHIAAEAELVYLR